MELYEDQFDAKHDTSVGTATKSLIIASTPRCGSHMLGHTLRTQGVFGFPLEYLNPPNLAEWKRRLAVKTAAEVCEALIARRTSADGVFSIKLHYDHLFTPGIQPELSNHFPDPRIVLITRRNLVAQAVSHAKASQTGQWIAGQPASSRNEPEYDYALIDRLLRKTARDNASWHHFLALSGVEWIHLNYEDILANTGEAVGDIAKLMGVSLLEQQNPVVPATTKQGAHSNADWEARFRSQDQGSPLFPRRARRNANTVKSVLSRLRRRVGH